MWEKERRFVDGSAIEADVKHRLEESVARDVTVQDEGNSMNGDGISTRQFTMNKNRI